MFMMVVGGAEWDAKEKNQKSKPLSQDTRGEKKKNKTNKKRRKRQKDTEDGLQMCTIF